MKNIKNTLLASSIILALAGCDDKDFKVPVNNTVNENAPTQVTDLVVDINESQFDPSVGDYGLVTVSNTEVYSLLGDAVDLDGDRLTVQNIRYTITDSEDENFDPDDNTGFSIANKSQLVVNPSALAGYLDSGQTRTAEYTFDISDGSNVVPRKITVNVHGRDFRPVVEGDLTANFTKSFTLPFIDLTEGVIDLDFDPTKEIDDPNNETLRIHSLEDVDGNPFYLPLTLSVQDGLLGVTVDVESVKDDIPANEFLEFNFTYKISDHKYTEVRDLTIGLLGVETIPGAPVFTNYFLKDEMSENDHARTYDLLEGVTDEEGDAFNIKDVQLNGSSDFPKGFMLEGSQLTFAPVSRYDSVAAGETETHVVSFQVEDELGNTSDGRRTLTITINGEDNNLMLANGFNANFENPANVGPLNDANTNDFIFGWANWACPVKEISAASARTGDYGFRLEGEYCDNRIASSFFIPELAADERYVMSYWLRTEETTSPNGNPYVPIYVGPGDGDEFWAGARFDNGDTLNEWQEHVQYIDSNGTKFSPYVGSGLWFGLLKYAGNGKHDIDDLNLTRISSFTHPAVDLISDHAGTFEAGETITASGGVAEIREVSGENKLYVNTTGETSVTVSLPVDAGYLREDVRYVIAFDVDNLTSEDGTSFNVDITNGTESISTSGWAADGSVEHIIWEADTKTNSVDWSAETMTFDITFTDADTEIHVDNIRLYVLP